MVPAIEATLNSEARQVSVGNAMAALVSTEWAGLNRWHISLPSDLSLTRVPGTHGFASHDDGINRSDGVSLGAAYAKSNGLGRSWLRSWNTRHVVVAFLENGLLSLLLLQLKEFLQA